MSKIAVSEKDALVVVDFQIDFCPGGALAVEEGDAIAPVVNRLLRIPVWLKVATRDWHPVDHSSFKEQGGTWPPHCIRDTEGASLHPKMDVDFLDLVISKGTRSGTDGYSGFDGTDLARELHSRNVERLFVCGLATDYCVRATAIEGRKEGFEVVVLEDAIRAVNLEPDDGKKALGEMSSAGCSFARSEDIAG